jgi:propanediol dehydratase small subunit
MTYPLYRDGGRRIRLASGRPIGDCSLVNLLAGRLGAADLGIHEETLREQARIADEAGFAPLARNLERAAEMTRLPDGKILEVYEALRRDERRGTLEALAREIERDYGATRTAAFLREAAAACEDRLP